jgi:hypothetical protein
MFILFFTEDWYQWIRTHWTPGTQVNRHSHHLLHIIGRVSLKAAKSSLLGLGLTLTKRKSEHKALLFACYYIMSAFYRVPCLWDADCHTILSLAFTPPPPPHLVPVKKLFSDKFLMYNVMFTKSSRYLNFVRKCNKRKKTTVYFMVL